MSKFGIAFAMPSVAPQQENQVDIENHREAGEFGDGATIRTDLTRPIMGIENRTPLEVFDIMVDRIKSAQAPAAPLDPLSLLATLVASAAAEKDHPRFIAGYMAGLTDARLERPPITQGDIDMAKHYAREAFYLAPPPPSGDLRPLLERALAKMVECLKP